VSEGTTQTNENKYRPVSKSKGHDMAKSTIARNSICPWLNMGDMLVKTTDWQTAQKIYANARRAG
jgi:hypothetical protein